MIYYINYKNKFLKVRDLGGDLEGFQNGSGNWHFSAYRADGAPFGLSKEELTDKNLYTRSLDNPDFKIEIPVNIDELNLKNNDEFNLSIDDARLTILKLNNYLKSITTFQCLEK